MKLLLFALLFAFCHASTSLPVACDTEFSTVGACDGCSYTTNGFLFCYPILQPTEVLVLRSIIPFNYPIADYDWRFRFYIDSCTGTDVNIQLLDALSYYGKLLNLSYSYAIPVLGIIDGINNGIGNCSHYNNSDDYYTAVSVNYRNFGVMVIQCSSTSYCAMTLGVHNATLDKYNSGPGDPTNPCDFGKTVNPCSTLLVAPLLYLFF